jgi:outer membrane scaffolding protein for murein synthesis (MipA/OmpV family)
LPRFTAQLDALYEVTGEHSGVELRGAVAGVLIDRPQGFGRFTAGTGFTWKSAALTTYYYGDEQLFPVAAAFNPFAKAAYLRPLSQHVSVNAFVHYEWLDRSLTQSPIVESDHVLSFFAGVTYAF